jgi:hydroxymethylglutaryl-CoA lyase
MRNANGERLFIHEVAPRDGFQIETRFIPTEEKVALINALARTGLAKIETTSFTSPRAIPALADAERVMAEIDRVAGVQYTALVPNVRGAARALESRADELNIVMSVSESHNQSNLRMSCAESLEQFVQITSFVGGKARIAASLSTAFGCPFEGEVPGERVFELVSRIIDLGINRVSICDTVGMADPAQVEHLFGSAIARWPTVEFTAHFHNTRGMGLANVLAALEAGVDRFDASLGGLGGCPYAPGATGNICTEDLVHMLDLMGYVTEVDLDRLLDCARRLPAIVQHDVPGQVLRAGRIKKNRKPVPL